MDKDHIDIDFKNFIVNIITNYGNLKPKYIVKYTTPESMKIFRKAFTHKSFDEIDNYETLELYGDAILNHLVMESIHKRLPDVVNVKWITKIKHFLMSKKALARVAINMGFTKHIRYGETMAHIMATVDYQKDERYLSMLEDTLEAFTESIYEVVKHAKKRRGIAYELTYNIITNMLGSVDLPLDHTLYFDAITRLKEINDEYKWFIDDKGNMGLTTAAAGPGMYKFYYSGYPLGDKTYIAKNKVDFPPAISSDKAEAKQKAAANALETLASKYNILEKIPDPYSRKN